MKWEKVKLGDIATFSNGINFNKTAYAKGIKLIGVSNFGDRFYPDYSQLQEVKKDIVRLEDCLRNGDIVFVRSNGNKELVGRCMLVKNPTERVTYSGFCIRARLNDTDRYDPVYFTYYFKSKAFRRAVSGTAVGANIQNLSQARLSNHECRIPSIEVQHRIADILSVYDDLIENNQKQIKLLEEAAQRLYKEWFVDLRFPGHENTKIVDGVPEGWRVSSIYDVFDIKYGKNLPTSKITKVGQYPVYGASGVIGYYNEKNCDDYVTLITSRGNGSGDVRRTHHKQSYVTNNSFIARRNDKNIFIKNEFTFQLFSNTDFKKLCTGSAQPQLTNTSIQKIKIFLPNRQLIEKYQGCTIEMSEKQEVLYKEQRALTQARNRLLSKLINGTVEV